MKYRKQRQEKSESPNRLLPTIVIFTEILSRFSLANAQTKALTDEITKNAFVNGFWGACHYLTNRFQMEAPVAPSRSLREAFKRAPRSLRGACLREGFAETPRRHHEPFAEVAKTEGSTKTPWRVHEASSKGPWMNCMLLLDHDCNRVWSILYCF